LSDFVFVPGVIQSPPDHRDWLYAVKAGPLPVALPSSYRLPEYPVGNQGPIGSCVGWASAAVKEYQENAGSVYFPLRFSPLFIYQECKKVDGMPDKEGTTLKAAMQVLQKIGACLERSHPYTTARPFPEPDPEDYVEAANYRVGNYVKIQTLEELKAAVMDTRTGAVLAAVLVCENFLKPEPGGFVPMPGGAMLGGHAIAVTGWNDTLECRYADGKTLRGFLRFRNSWGPEWGDRGYGWLPYNFFRGRTDLGVPYFFEAWTSIDLASPPTPVNTIELWIGKTEAKVDGMVVALDQPPVVDSKTNRTLVPLRFVGEMTGYRVDYHAREQRIMLTRRQ
jgi:hypothetical protein